jgi:hypothetical protein
MDNGNGTFLFQLNIDKPAGEYELVLNFEGYPTTGQMIIPPLKYVTVINVNHPIVINLSFSSERVFPGDDVEISGSLVDDTGRAAPSVPLQIWGEDRLLETKYGVYIDDVDVWGAKYFYNCENGPGGWTTYTTSEIGVENQWEHGTTTPPDGPSAWSGVRLWGTNLQGHYERGAWSYLVSPPLNMFEEKEYILSFRAWWDLSGNEDKAYVLVSQDGGLTWDEENPMVFTDANRVSGDWKRLKFTLSEYAGSDGVRIAFVFFSSPKTLEVNPDGTFTHIHRVPNSTDVGFYDFKVVFNGNLLYQEAEEEARIIIRRTTRIELDDGISNRTGYRNQPITIKGKLLDDRGEVLKTEIDGHRYYYSVIPFWPPKGWTIDDGIREPPYHRYPYVDRDTGEFSITYVVEPDHDLGPVNISIRFNGDDFYTGVQVVEVFQVKAHLYVRIPPPENRTFHRGQVIDLGAELRVVPSESIEDPLLGDLVTREYVKIFWNGSQIANRRSESGDYFDVDYLVGSTHALGNVAITFEYDGSSIYEPFTQRETYYVISDTFITIEDAVVTRGSWVYIHGKISDDKGQPIPNLPIYIIWKRAPELGRATSKRDGNFWIQYYVEYEERAGNISVIARFKGDYRYMASENRSTFSIVQETILHRKDRTSSISQERSLEVSAGLYEDHGGYRGTEMPREVITLTLDGVLLDSKRTAFDGSVTFTVYIDPQIYQGGPVDLVLSFNGSDHIGSSSSVSTIFIQVSMYLNMDLEINGRPFTPAEDVARHLDTVNGLVTVFDQEEVPWPDREVSIYYLEANHWSTERFLLTTLTNDIGQVAFNHLLDSEIGGEVSYVVTSPGLTYEFRIFLKYIVPPPPSGEHIISITGDKVVEVGSELDLRVKARPKEDWDIDNLTYALVSPLDGMSISHSGTIKWEPTEDQVGTHQVTIWLYDGDTSKTTSVEITVSEDSGPMEDLGTVLFGIINAVILTIFISIVYWMKRKKE